MKKQRTWKVVGVVGEHFHLVNLLTMARQHPRVELAGVCDPDPARLRILASQLHLPSDKIFNDYRKCLETCRPDLAVLCPATARHGLWVERIAPYGAHLLIEKPFAARLEEADRMIAAAKQHRIKLAINWPLRWSPPMVAAHRLLNEGTIGDLQEVHYYSGNRGPLRLPSGKIEARLQARKRSWFYQRRSGGGSLLDYLGYGTTLGTWYHGGAHPTEVMCLLATPYGAEVDDHSITVARYPSGLSKFETRWGTLTDPWKHQPLPKCGFVLKGTTGSIGAWSGESRLRVQTARKPEGFDIVADKLRAPERNPIEFMIHCLETGKRIDGPLSPTLARIGQQIVEGALLSARLKRSVPLPVE